MYGFVRPIMFVSKPSSQTFAGVDGTQRGALTASQQIHMLNFDIRSLNYLV